MRSQIKHYHELSRDELYDILYLRCEVFVVEQNCPYQDCDGKDKTSDHYMVYDGKELIAYSRVLMPGEAYEEHAIGRVVIKASHRQRGLGKVMMSACIEHIRAIGGHSIRISAQAYLKAFYESLGFVAVSDQYLEDDIPHLEMLLDLD